MRDNESDDTGMTDERLDALLNDAKSTYRVPPEAPVDAMWSAIDEAIAPVRVTSIDAPRRRDGRWGLAVGAAAAAFVLGVGLGRQTAGNVAGEPVAVVASAPEPAIASVGEPLVRTATNYLGDAEALIRSVQAATSTDGTYASEAATLLMTTRLLLDSPAASDARLRALLEDLELALVQIASLRGEASAQKNSELQYIRHVLSENEMVPRLRTAAVTLASYE